MSGAPGAASAGGTSPDPDSKLRELDRPLIRFLHLAVLVTFAVGQPLFDVLSKEPEFFASRGSERMDIFLFALGVTIIPALVMVGVEQLVALASRSAAQITHLAFVGVTAAVAILYFLVKYVLEDGSTALLLVLALALGAVAALIYRRLSQAEEVRGLLAWLSGLAVVFFLVNFLFVSDMSNLTLGGSAEAHEANVDTDAPIVVLGFDEFPATSLLNSKGQIDARRYPNFARFAKDSTWFPNATGVHDRTTKAYPAILDGKNPRDDSLPVADDHPDNLFTVFRDSHDLTNVSEAATRLCPPDICKGTEQEGFVDRMRSLADDLDVVYRHVVFPKGLTENLPPITNTLGNFGGDGAGDGDDHGTGGPSPAGGKEDVKKFEQGIVAKVRGSGRAADYQRWVQNIRTGDKPSLNFNHIFFPHVPWQYMPSGNRYLRGPEEMIAGQTERTIADDFLVEQAYQRHLLQTGFTDRLLGQMIDTLKRKGLYDKALIVLVGDHGATFTKDMDRRVVNNENIQDLANVPLFVKAPNQKRGDVNDALVRTTDIMPTIADLLDIELPYDPDGVSMFSEEVEERDGVEMIQGEQATIGKGTGVVAKATREEFEAKQRAALRRMIALFGEGSFANVFRLGPNKQLLGRQAASVPRASAAGARAEVFRAGDLRDVNPQSGFIPLQVGGRITGGGAPRKRDLALAVNGRIVAVGESFRGPLKNEVENFAMFAPESAFRKGRNRVDVYEVTGAGALARLGGA